MYTGYFGLTELPFAITPDPHYLFMSERHREAYAHLLYGLSEGGGFVQLTGEVGTGKTTLCRCVLEALPDHVDVAFILNPRLTDVELLATICDELHIDYPAGELSLKALTDVLHRYLLDAQARGRRTVVIIDEAQNLAIWVLEQIRLLTNLETTTQKLLQMILIGQPELNQLLNRQDLRQLAQRITARYHLLPLTYPETRAYVLHRLEVAGATRPLFTRTALREVYRYAKGVPRLVNVVCDRALLGAYVQERHQVGAATVRRAVAEVTGQKPIAWWRWLLRWGAGAAGIAAIAVAGFWIGTRYERPAVAVKPAGTSQVTAAAPTPLPVPTAEPTPTPPAPTPAPPVQVEPAPLPTPIATPAPPVTSTPEPTPVTLAELLGNAAVRGSKDAAYEKLFALWGIVDTQTLSTGLRCEDARLMGLRCVFKSGTWQDLKKYNRPAMLELTLPGGSPRYGVLSGVRGDRAKLILGEQTHEFPIREIDQFWRGQYIRLRASLPTELRITPGMRGREVVWVRRRLAILARRDPKAETSDVYDAELKARVVDFQESRGLVADGVILPDTLRALGGARPSGAYPNLGGRAEP